MEKRKSKRFKTGDRCSGKLIVGKNIKIINMSFGGICVKIIEHLIIDKIYKIEIACSKSKTISLSTVVVWSSFQGTVKKKDNVLPVYEVGLKFIELTDTDKEYLDKLVSNLSEKDIAS